MFDFVRNNTRIFFFVLLLLVVPSFILVGNGDRLMGRDPAQKEVASVGGHKIIQAELDGSVRQLLDRRRRLYPDKDIKELDTPELRREVLDDLVRRLVLAEAVREFRIQVTDDQVKNVFARDQQFAFLRNPDGTVNRAVLAGQGMTSEGFAEILRQSIAQQRLTVGLDSSSFVPASLTQAGIGAFFQQREVQVQYFNPQAYASKVVPTDAELEAFYKAPATAERFAVPEQLDIEYVVMSQEVLSRGIQVSEEELAAAYEQGLKASPPRFVKPESRRASHILINLGGNEQERAKARAKAEALLVQLKANPRTFAEVARKNSEDAGSAPSGGDLGYLTRDDLVKPFAEALYQLKEGEISDVVQSELGLHIILLTGLHPGEVRPFDSVRSELLAEIRKTQVSKKFADAAVDFTNMVFEQADTLKPAADKWKLEIHSAKNLQRTMPASAGPILSHPKLLEALFSNDVLRDKRNTPAVEIGADQIVAARVAQHSPSRQPTLEEVKEKVRQAYVVREAAVLARNEGEARFAALKAAPPATLSQPVELVSRSGAGSFPLAHIEKVLRAPATSLPGVLGLEMGEKGYAVVLITRVVGLDPAVQADAEATRTGFAQVVQEAEGKAYYEALKKRFKVSVKTPQQ